MTKAVINAAYHASPRANNLWGLLGQETCVDKRGIYYGSYAKSAFRALVDKVRRHTMKFTDNKNVQNHDG